MNYSRKTDRLLVLCDDEEPLRRRWHGFLKEAGTPAEFSIREIRPEEYEYGIKTLHRRRKDARGGIAMGDDGSKTIFDEADILVIDYDLLAFDELAETGESLSYLARCYSQTGLIIGLNQFAQNGFDLTLRGHPESFADLNVGSAQLGNPGLWRMPSEGFRPWEWPLLPQALEAFEDRVQQVQDNLETKIFEYFGFPGDLIEQIPRPALDFLSGGRSPEEVTFRSVVTDSGSGIRLKDKTTDDIQISRIAAARISTWLERLILAGQEILVDAPHLVWRFPGLIPDANQGAIDPWNRTAILGTAVENLGFNYQLIEECRFTAQSWLSRHAWFWHKVRRIPEIRALGGRGEAKMARVVFCEDISRFVPEDCAREFVADLPSPFVRRYVVDQSAPLAHDYLTSPGGNRACDVTLVDYTPAVRFLM